MPLNKKRRKSIIDELFGGSIFEEAQSLFEKLPEELSGNAYSISVVQTLEGTKVRAKVGKDTDVNAFRRQLQQQYPGAQIEIEGGREEPLIREISTKTLKKGSEDKNQNKPEE
ncbi:MAG: hypothetical protein QW667_04220 [Candidatus Bathyarchaeia archaeon]